MIMRGGGGERGCPVCTGHDIVYGGLVQVRMLAQSVNNLKSLPYVQIHRSCAVLLSYTGDVVKFFIMNG